MRHGNLADMLDNCMADIAEELADVMVLWEQIRLHYGLSIQDIQGIMKEKVERQLKRIENEKGR